MATNNVIQNRAYAHLTAQERALLRLFQALSPDARVTLQRAAQAAEQQEALK